MQKGWHSSTGRSAQWVHRYAQQQVNDRGTRLHPVRVPAPKTWAGESPATVSMPSKRCRQESTDGKRVAHSSKEVADPIIMSESVRLMKDGDSGGKDRETWLRHASLQAASESATSQHICLHTRIICETQRALPEVRVAKFPCRDCKRVGQKLMPSGRR